MTRKARDFNILMIAISLAYDNSISSEFKHAVKK